jgi:hypothetical protein
LRGESLYRTRSCRDKPRLAKRDTPGQDTGRSQGHLSSCLLGGAPGKRHRAICKKDRQRCDTPGWELDKCQAQIPRRTGQTSHRTTLCNPEQTRDATTRSPHVGNNPTEAKQRTTRHRADTGTKPGQQTCKLAKLRRVVHRSTTPQHRDGWWAAKQTPPDRPANSPREQPRHHGQHDRPPARSSPDGPHTLTRRRPEKPRRTYSALV